MCEECKHGNTKHTIEECKQWAINKGGECLSDKYINSKTPLLWKCKNPEHKPWKARIDHIKKRNHSDF